MIWSREGLPGATRRGAEPARRAPCSPDDEMTDLAGRASRAG